MEAVLQKLFGDLSIRLIVLTSRITHSPRDVASDFCGSVKYLLIYNPIRVEAELDSDDDQINSNDDSSFSHELTKKVLTCENFISLRRMCYEFEAISIALGADDKPNNEHGNEQVAVAVTGSLKAGEKRSLSFDPDECSICMDASIDIVLPCLHGYCSACWEDWSSHSSTCPHCRDEVKGSSQSQSQSSAQGAGGGHDEIWQFENWGEADSRTQRAEVESTLRRFVSQLPMNFSADVMTSHRILTNEAPAATGGG